MYTIEQSTWLVHRILWHIFFIRPFLAHLYFVILFVGVSELPSFNKTDSEKNTLRKQSDKNTASKLGIPWLMLLPAEPTDSWEKSPLLKSCVRHLLHGEHAVLIQLGYYSTQIQDGRGVDTDRRGGGEGRNSG